MPIFCWFYGFTPAEYRALTLDDRASLAAFMSQRLKAEAEAGKGRR